MNQSENKVIVEGILSEVDLTTGSYIKNGVSQDYIRGSVKVRVEQEISGQMLTMEVPVHTFVTRITKNGTENPAYKSMLDVMNNFTSIAAAGDINKADRVRITSGVIKENAFYSKNGELVSTARIETSFINKISALDCQPKAEFIGQIVVGSKCDELDRDGMPTGRMMLNGVMIQYGDRADLIRFIVADNAAQTHINQYWDDGATVRIKGKLNFTSKTEYVEEEMGFGEPIKTVKTTAVHELIIVSGSPAGLEGDAAYNINEIQSALAARKLRIEESKNKNSTKPTTSVPNFGF